MSHVKHYLTRDEAVRMNAASNYTSRKLTPIERVIKHVITVNAMPNDTQKEKAAKADEVETVVKVLSEHTSSEYLLAKVRLASYNKVELKALLDGYPYVQFEGLLNGEESLTNIEQFARGGFKLEDLQSIMFWAVELHELYAQLPKGRETFIYTPRTADYDFRVLANTTKDPKYYGYALPKEVQKNVATLFHETASGYGNIRKMFHLRGYDLLNVPNIWKRAAMGDEVAAMLNPNLKIEFVTHKAGWTQFPTVMLTDESTKTKLHFVVSG